MNKGFVFTLDSFIAISLIGLIVVISLSLLFQIDFSAWENIQLSNIAQDELFVLKEANVLESAVIQNSINPLLSYIGKTPNSFCFEIKIYNENDSVPFLTAIKSGCVKGDSFVVISDSFVVQEEGDINFYLVRLGAWYNEL